MSDAEEDAWTDGGGCFHYRDFVDEKVVSWAAAADVARDWWADSTVRNVTKGAWKSRAHDLLGELSQTGNRAALEVIQALVDSAASDEELIFVGASPLEDLLSHNHHAAAFVDDVEARARQQPRFKTALSAVWLDREVPEPARIRLAAFGATLL